MDHTPPTPDDITNVQFRTEMRGYDVNEVDVFLDEVAERVRLGHPAIDPNRRIGFTVTLRGYSRAEVDAFIARLGTGHGRTGPATAPDRPRTTAVTEEPKGFLARLFGR